ncbi:metallophosphoesterase [Tindallia californiensis]|uniref:Calcineurin-like phosphoesterase n=1 Tax=Tindallia californiensis TaxID=159292 RepID=A0A1H3MT87_9FIRM|nr:metallophosphoesterase [Tindallia californiensis]SDY79660.1 Calcineurin-like phosphoesterase [Tindallia californiensis]
MGKFVSESKAFICGLAHQPYVPGALRRSEGPFILHISDTPVQIYEFVFKVIKAIKPAVIIHTGDLADNYKIENRKEQIPHYKRAVKYFMETLKIAAEEAEIIVTLGNHDLENIIGECEKISVDPEQPVVLFNKKFFLHHEMCIEGKEKGYYCFGHQYEPEHQTINGVVYLNGLLNINVIDVNKWETYHLKYPIGTNEYRKMTHRRTGL